MELCNKLRTLLRIYLAVLFNLVGIIRIFSVAFVNYFRSENNTVSSSPTEDYWVQVCEVA